jgi:hypothetical protein
LIPAPDDWASVLDDHFPAYLLPHAERSALSVGVAERFLDRLVDRPELVELLLHVSMLVEHLDDLEALVGEALPRLVRTLPSSTERQRRTWHGGFQGRLAVGPTLQHHLAGETTTFVTDPRRRTFDLPENRLVRAVVVRLLRLLARLRRDGLLPAGGPNRESEGWATRLVACEVRLRHLLHRTALAHVPEDPVGRYEAEAARAGRDAAYHRAAAWWRRLEDVRAAGPDEVARCLAEGALRPLSEARRFELAVLLQLLLALDAACPDGWTMSPMLVVGGRSEVAIFEGPDEARIRVWFDTVAHLPAGRRDTTAEHYLGAGRLRPDVTLVREQGGRLVDACVVEVKHSRDPSYLATGLGEAWLYREEYAPVLRGWPKAVLVTSGPVRGALRRDDVVAVSWKDWVPHDFLAAWTSFGERDAGS